MFEIRGVLSGCCMNKGLHVWDEGCFIWLLCEQGMACLRWGVFYLAAVWTRDCMFEIRGVLSGCCVVWTWNVVICSSGVIGAPDNRVAQYFPPWFNIDRSDFLNKWYFVSYLYNPVSHPPSRFYCILPWFCIKWLYKHVQIIFTNFVWPFYPLMIQSWLWSSMPIVVWLIGTATANNTIQHKSASTYCMARLSR